MGYATYEEQMMTEALAEHDDGCCTEQAPCVLRVGVSKTLANHKMTPDFIAREERQAQTGSGQGRTWKGEKKVSPTEAQVRIWESLMSQLREFGHEDKATILDAVWNDCSKFAEYSEMLNGGKKMVERLRAEQRTQQTKRTEMGLSEGMYKVGDKVYKVKRSQAGYLYALALTEDGFQFNRGAIRNIKPEHRLTLDQAKEYGRQTGQCCVCGTGLTNETSVREGIGPVCGGRI